MNNNLKNLVKKFIEKSKNLNVCIIGETIIDQFIFVNHQGTSMKSNCPALKLTSEFEKQTGGSSVIANHIKDFVNNLNLITNNKEEIVKTRYLEKFGGKKHVEINKFETNNFKKFSVNPSDYDLVIVADFGHSFCDKLTISDNFYLMCQTNSANFGFNRVSKWKHYKKINVCVDKREASLQLNKNVDFNDINSVKELYDYELNCSNLIVTLGENGALFFDGKNHVQCKSFKTNVIDTIGAGDTFYIFSCIATHIGFDPEEILQISSLAASISTTWLGNKEYITKEKLTHYENRII